MAYVGVWYRTASGSEWVNGYSRQLPARYRSRFCTCASFPGEMKSQTRAREQQRTKRGHGRLPNVVALVEQILDGDESFETVRDAARDKRIEREVAAQAKEILVIVKL